jgi:hypothetical protein
MFGQAIVYRRVGSAIIAEIIQRRRKTPTNNYIWLIDIRLVDLESLSDKYWSRSMLPIDAGLMPRASNLIRMDCRSSVSMSFKIWWRLNRKTIDKESMNINEFDCFQRWFSLGRKIAEWNKPIGKWNETKQQSTWISTQVFVGLGHEE